MNLINPLTVPANPRTSVRMKGGSYLVFENCAGESCEEDIMKDEERITKIEEAMKTLTDKIDELMKAQETEKETQKNEEKETEKSLAETLVNKLTEIDDTLKKLSKESTGRDSGSPLSDITDKDWKDMKAEEKSLAWRYVLKGG